MRLVAKIAGSIFFIFWMLASLILFFDYWQVLTSWLGAILGSIVAFLASPGVFLFPFVYWLVQGAFPVFYFELLAVCAGSALISGLFFSIGVD